MKLPGPKEIHRRFRQDVAVAKWRKKPAKDGAPVVEVDGPWVETNRVFLDLARRFELAHRKRYAAIRTEKQVIARASEVRKILRRVTGLPATVQRTPLKPVVESGLGGEGYRLEKVLIQSRPGMFVTGNMYLPADSVGPYPAIIHACGHSLNGKGFDDYRTTCINFARKGFAVFIFDPAGQGERDEYVDVKTGRRTVARACRSHGAIGDPMYLAGLSFAAIRLHDAMRCVDYLQSRKDVIGSRIGVVGKSGGGWEGLWLAALDSRVRAVSTGNYFTSFRRRMENRGADSEPDPEQDPFGILAMGVDAADLIVACYPRPVLVCSTTRDFFPLDGAVASFKLARRLYAIGGFKDRLRHGIGEGAHEMPAALRRMTCGWMKKWVACCEGGNLVEEEVKLSPERETYVTRGGIVLSSLGGISVPEAGALQTLRVISRRKKSNARGIVARLADRLRGLASARERPLVTRLAGVTRLVDRVTSAGVRVGEEEWRTSDGVRLAARTWEPKKRRGGVLLCAGCDLEGRLELNPGAESMAESGFVVLELQPRAYAPAVDTYGDFVPLREAITTYNSFLVGRPLIGYRVADMRLGFARLRSVVGPNQFVGVSGKGEGALFALLAAVLDGKVDGVIEGHGLTNWSSIALNRSYGWPVSVILPGALCDFDLEDLRAGIFSKPVNPEVCC